MFELETAFVWKSFIRCYWIEDLVIKFHLGVNQSIKIYIAPLQDTYSEALPNYGVMSRSAQTHVTFVTMSWDPTL